MVESARQLFRGFLGIGASAPASPAHRELQRAEDVVLRTLVPLTATLALLFLAFSILDPWLLDPRYDPGAYHPSVSAAGPRPLSLSPWAVQRIAIGLAVVTALIHLWLSRRPPPTHWANAVAFGVGLVWLLRAVSYVIASPTLFRIELLAIGFVICGCIFLSLRWMISYVIVATIVWFAVAYYCNPYEPWHRCSFVVLASAAVSLLVCDLRCRSTTTLLSTTQLDDRLQGELSRRFRLGETSSRISSRFLRTDALDLSNAVDWALGEIGQTLQVHRAFLCRFNHDRLTIATTNEWNAPADSPASSTTEHHVLDRIWFSEKVLASHVTVVPDVHNLPVETQDDHGVFKRIGARAFASIPLATSRQLPWGYLGVAHHDQPVDWSADDLQFLRSVGENLLLTIERHEAEIALRRSEARFRQLFDANLFSAFFANIYGTITDANDAFFELTGRERADLPLRWDAVIPLGWRAHYEASITRLVTRSVDPPKELELLTTSGRRVPVLLGSALLLRDRGEFIAFAIDLTEQREAERKVQELHAELGRAARLGMMGEMAAGLAHEVHQPLAAISNYAHGARRRLQRGRLSDEELIEVFEEIGQLCEQAGGVVGNIRQFVRGRHPGREAVSVNDAIERSLEISRFEVLEHEILIETDLDKDLPPAHTNATELTQILLNLILNAAHAMEPQESERRLQIKSRLGVDSDVEILIRDSGPGIPPDVRPRLFDQFFTTKENGLGMGLSLSRSIAESHGGQLTLLETDSQGTTFLLQLPIVTHIDATP